MSNNWVDYKLIKDRVSMEMVLNHYGLLGKLRESGNNLVGCCPIHQGSNPRQFSVSLDRNIFNCFGNCKAGGNVLDFVARIEQIPVREAALLLKDWFPEPYSDSKDVQLPTETEKRVRKEGKSSVKRETNPPLQFELKSITCRHPFFEERGILQTTVQHFGLGFCSKGIMKGRAVIPIHDEQARLVAYCGRAVTPEQTENHGKYRMPADFVKSAIVYNLHRQSRKESVFILVESFFSVFNLYQAGFPNCLALMGSSLSELQEQLIVESLGPNGCAILLFDGDEDGQKCTLDCLGRLSPHLFVKAVNIKPHAHKPHQLTTEQIKDLI